MIRIGIVQLVAVCLSLTTWEGQTGNKIEAFLKSWARIQGKKHATINFVERHMIKREWNWNQPLISVVIITTWLADATSSRPGSSVPTSAAGQCVSHRMGCPRPCRQRCRKKSWARMVSRLKCIPRNKKTEQSSEVENLGYLISSRKWPCCIQHLWCWSVLPPCFYTVCSLDHFITTTSFRYVHHI